MPNLNFRNLKERFSPLLPFFGLFASGGQKTHENIKNQK